MTAVATMSAAASAGFLCAYTSGVCGGVTSGETAVREAAQLPEEERKRKIRALRLKWHPDKVRPSSRRLEWESASRALALAPSA